MTAESETILHVSGLTKKFGGLVALDGIDLTAKPGEILGLIGPNGSGKTTTFNVITGLYAASGGTVMFQGEDITSASPQRVYRAGITRTFQQSRLSLPLSIFDNVMIGNHSRLNQGIWFNLMSRSAFRREYEAYFTLAVNLVRIFNAQLANRIFEPVEGLTMIDRRRIEICRALISAPRLLLLDEPSAGMTQDETRQLMDDILEVRSQMEDLTIIMVEHEMGVIERVTDRCVVVNFGKKIAEGTYAEIATNNEVQEAYLGIQE